MKKRRFPCYLSILLSLLVLYGCGGPLSFSYAPPKGPDPPKKIKARVSVLIAPFADARMALVDPGNPRVIGSISSTVSDMEEGRLTLSEDVPAIVTSAFVKELAAAGYIVTDDKAGADIELIGEVEEFRLDIGSRDEVAMRISSKFTERKTNKVIWSGSFAEKGERFAGVSGNSRRTISSYLSESLSKAIRGGLSEAGERITARMGAAYAQQAGEEGIPEGQGRLNITAAPQRSKVYLNGVYYGMTPISLDIGPGVYDVALRQQGFKEGIEKVSVRKGRLTELEIILEKE
ncbi:MAG: PEGA domain-containing protein [Deltaproteobacteria bacterium]|nr:PEGA domain-containing protein [Deltaproteobacteria bacterium]